MTGAVPHLEESGVVRGATGELVMDRDRLSAGCRTATARPVRMAIGNQLSKLYSSAIATRRLMAGWL